MIYIDKFNFEIACAAKCINPADAIKQAGLPEETETKIADGIALPPAEVGKLAEALKVSPKEIARSSGYGITVLDN